MRALVLANGPLGPVPPLLDAAGRADVVIAADGGARHAEPLGASIDLVIGDLDSIDPGLLRRLERGGAEVRRFPARKDEIDLELALLEALRRGAREAFVVGALGARWDQTLANVMLALAPPLAGLSIVYLEGSQSIRVLRGPARLEIGAAPGSTLSLIPLSGAARGLRSRGLEYALDGDELPCGTPRGVSNLVAESPASLALEEGALCVVVIEKPATRSEA